MAFRFPFTSLPTVFVIEPNVPARFFSSQLWYFRALPGQNSLQLQIPSIGRECGIQITTADGKTVLTQVQTMAGRETKLSLDLKPGETYRLITTQDGSNPNIIVPVQHPLVLARTPEEWFAPKTE